MTDYAELIKALRNCAEVNSLSQYKRGLMRNAADAIEDLEFVCNRYEKDYKALCALTVLSSPSPTTAV